MAFVRNHSSPCSRGREALSKKQRFYELGYFRTMEFSDRISDTTLDTVKLYEKNNSLSVNDVADAVMLGVLYSNSAVGR